MRSMIRSMVVVMMAGLLLVSGTGCDPCSYTAGFAGGWLAATGNVFGTTEVVCYRNGELVDCGSLPQDIAP